MQSRIFINFVFFDFQGHLLFLLILGLAFLLKIIAFTGINLSADIIAMRIIIIIFV